MLPKQIHTSSRDLGVLTFKGATQTEWWSHKPTFLQTKGQYTCSEIKSWILLHTASTSSSTRLLIQLLSPLLYFFEVSRGSIVTIIVWNQWWVISVSSKHVLYISQQSLCKCTVWFVSWTVNGDSHTHTYIYTCIQTCIRTYVNIYTYIRTHTRT